MTKKCFKCRKIKPIGQFYRHLKMADGHLGKCKNCTKKDAKIRYYSKAGREACRAYEKKRFHDPERKAKIKEYSRNMRIRRPGVYKARMALSHAVRDGRVIKLPCEVCGNPNSQGHHKDYRKKLTVQWLCFKHHREIEHGQIVG